MKRPNIFLLLIQSVKARSVVLGLSILFVSLRGLNAQELGIKDISLPEAGTGEEIRFSQFESSQAIGVIFFCNSCPYSTFYVDRIKELVSVHRGVQFILINSNSSEFVPTESVANMAKLKNDEGIGIPYLADKEQLAQDIFSAKKCPEAFIILPKDGWKVVYRGAIDDNPQVASDVKEEYFKNALTKVLNGSNPDTDYQRPTGCVIK